MARKKVTPQPAPEPSKDTTNPFDFKNFVQPVKPKAEPHARHVPSPKENQRYVI